MLESTYNELADLALKRTGQTIPISKSYLMETRLSAITRREGFGSLDDLANCLKARPNPVFEAEITAALVSKESYWFRDRDILTDIVENILPARLKASNTGRLKIWCAGGSSGQEAYSLAILLSETGQAALKGARIDIVSTDVCKSVTEKARRGHFGHFDVQRGLSIHRLLTHFHRLETEQWEISEALRGRVSFRQHNLMEDCSVLGQYDVILCRHVLSGMSRASRMRVADALAAQLSPGGVIALGQGEGLIGLTDALEPARGKPFAWVAAGTANAAAA